MTLWCCNGLDDFGNPVPADTYYVKVTYSGGPVSPNTSYFPVRVDDGTPGAINPPTLTPSGGATAGQTINFDIDAPGESFGTYIMAGPFRGHQAYGN